MAEVKKIATRESYGKALVELGAIDPRVVAIDADLAGSTKTGTDISTAASRNVMSWELRRVWLQWV